MLAMRNHNTIITHNSDNTPSKSTYISNARIAIRLLIIAPLIIIMQTSPNERRRHCRGSWSWSPSWDGLFMTCHVPWLKYPHASQPQLKFVGNQEAQLIMFSTKVYTYH